MLFIIVKNYKQLKCPNHRYLVKYIHREGKMFMEELEEHRACLCVDGKKQGSKFYLQNDHNCVVETGRRKNSLGENPRKCLIFKSYISQIL